MIRRWSGALALLLGVALLLPLVPYVTADKFNPIVVPNPGTELWREVRDATKGTTQVEGVNTDVLVSDDGERWRRYRMQQLAPYGAMVLGVMVGIFALYYLIRGKIRIEAGRSGRVVRRYTTTEMVVHWILAITFVILALSSLVLLYGRWVLIPLLGPEGFSITATVCISLHNYVGLLFTAIIPIAFFIYLKDSLFNMKVDGKWFMRMGGYLGGKEPSAEKVNAGQKTWYWVAMLGGVVLIGSGLVLDFPNFQQAREWLQVAHVVHTLVAFGVMAFFIVHIYLGTLGEEGALESMVTGHVDENWAKQHHDLWYEEIKNTAVDENSIRTGGEAGVTEQRPADAS